MPQAYIAATKTALATSPVIASFVIVEEWTQPDRGYVRFRAELRNGDFLESSEYFIVDTSGHSSARYSYQWMDNAKTTLQMRWDNVAHHPGLTNFPHHIHRADGQVVSGQSLTILELLQLLESIVK